MFLKFRPARVRDLDECLGCLRDGFAYDAGARASLLEMWGELLASGAASGAVMEDVSEAVGRRIVFFCFKVFVGDEYVQFLKSESGPMVGVQVLTAWLKGMSPCLSLEEVRRANSEEGVNILVLNSGLPERMWASDQLRYLVDRIGEFSCYFTSGYRCKELLEEFYTDFEYQWAAGGGLSGSHAVWEVFGSSESAGLGWTSMGAGAVRGDCGGGGGKCGNAGVDDVWIPGAAFLFSAV